MRRIRGYHDVSDGTGHDVLDQVLEQHRRLERRLARVGRVLAVASGKGGVGKSLITANLAAALAHRGRRVGAADADLNGPSLARMLGAAGQRLRVDASGVHPATGAAGVRTMSMELLLADDDSPVGWRTAGSGSGSGSGSGAGAGEGEGAVDADAGGGGGEAGAGPSADFVWQSTLETGTVREFLADVAWGELDYLLVDVPPGTDKIARLLDLVPRLDGVLIVTTPSEMARAVVARSVRQVHDAKVPVVGLIANMTAHVCEACGHASPLYTADGARRLARSAGVALWSEIPFEPGLAAATDAGAPPVLSDDGLSPASSAIRRLAGRVEFETRRDGGSP